MYGVSLDWMGGSPGVLGGLQVCRNDWVGAGGTSSERIHPRQNEGDKFTERLSNTRCWWLGRGWLFLKGVRRYGDLQKFFGNCLIVSSPQLGPVDILRWVHYGPVCI